MAFTKWLLNKKTLIIANIVLAIFMLQSYAVDNKDSIFGFEVNPFLVKLNEVYAADALIRENYLTVKNWQ